MKKGLNKNNQGISLYFVILILFVLTTVLLSLVSLSVSQMKIIWGLNNSVNAFFASDTGIEHSLYNIRKEGGTGNVSGNLNEAEYNVSVTINGEIIIKSTGVFHNIRRAIEIKY